MRSYLNSDQIQYIKALVKKAGDLAFERQLDILKVHRKHDRSIVTEMDTTVQNILIKSLTEQFNNVNFIYEENFDRSQTGVNEDTLSFIIDPIDGTAMYSMNLPIWCISLGVFYGYRPVYGFVYAPGARMFFYNDDTRAYLNDEQVQVNHHVPIESETNIFYASEIHDRYSFSFPGKIRNLGSTAFQGCLLVDNDRNRSIAFVGRSYLWDWAGAIPVLLKAGGSVRYISGNEIDYNEIIKNGYRMCDYTVAYTCSSFEKVMEYFKKI